MIINNILGARAPIHGIIAIVATEIIVVCITNDQVIARTAAHLFNADQRIRAAHAIAGNTVIQIDTDSLGRRIGSIIDHIAGAATAIHQVIALQTAEAIIGSTAEHGIGERRPIHRSDAHQAIRAPEAIGCDAARQVNRNPAGQVGGGSVVVRKNTILTITISDGVIADGAEQEQIGILCRRRGDGDAVPITGPDKQFKALDTIRALRRGAHRCRIDPRIATA